MPRKDLKVTVDGVPIKPSLALGSWAAFSSSGDNAMAMGDLVLTEDEVGPVMAKLQQGGIEVTALHNHVLHESPRVMYMHIAGHGNAAKLAQAIHDAVALTGTPAESPAAAAGAKIELDTDKIDEAMGRKGKDNGGIYQFGVARAESIRDHGMEIPASMGVSTAINFQPTGNGHAAITGDFVLLGSEVNPVIAALRENGIQVTALHSHMLTEEPRLFFMHFWANDDAVKLAHGLRAALDKTNSKK
jgi:biotin operon repressor